MRKSDVATAGSGPAVPPREGGFFTYHGIWAPGVRLFRSLRFSAKAVILSLAFLVPLLALLGWQLSTQYEQSMQARKDATRQHVEIAHGILVWAHGLETAGTLSREQAQQLAQRSISGLRYDKVEYFWINDMQARMVMHPIKPELNGKDLSGMKDPSGFALFQGFVAKVHAEGKGFVGYLWPRPGSEQPVAKISYVHGFEPWGWIIGSGVYVDDVRAAFVHQLMIDSAIVAAALLVAGYLFLSFFRVMDGGLKETRRHLRAMTDGDLATSPHAWGRDEAAELMRDLSVMQDSMRGMVRRVRSCSDQIVASSAEIASGALDLSARTEAAAASLEESAASMEQISATVKTTSDHTEEASHLARRNARELLKGK